jgi:branched-subunit amino acid ABC-type transport system permease component
LQILLLLSAYQGISLKTVFYFRAHTVPQVFYLQYHLAGGGIENWFAYVLALLFLLVRPQGLFGERIIERV